MNIEALKHRAETRQVKLVFKNSVNDYNTLFGGTALQWMDEVAYITATRFCRNKVVTVSADRIKFEKPIQYGTICEIIGQVGEVGSLKLEVLVTVFIENKYEDKKEKAVEGVFQFVTIDNNSKPVKLLVH